MPIKLYSLSFNDRMPAISLIIVLMMLCLNSCSTGHKTINSISNSNRDVETIKKLEYDWLAAEFKLDTASISPMMDNTFISVGLHGTSNKQQELKAMYDNISRRLKENHVIDSFYLDNMHIQLYDKTAVVTFFTVTKGKIKDVPFENRRTRFYDVWIKRNGQWKAVSSQGTPVP